MLSVNTADQRRAMRNDPDRVHVVGTIVEMVLIMAVMVLLNLFPDRIGIIPSLTDPSGVRPLLAPEFQVHMPWLNVYWGLALCLCALNLTLGRWTPHARWAELGLNVLAAYILLGMVTGGPLTLYPGVTLAVKVALAIALVVTSIATIVKLVQLVTRELSAAQPR